MDRRCAKKPSFPPSVSPSGAAALKFLITAVGFQFPTPKSNSLIKKTLCPVCLGAAGSRGALQFLHGSGRPSQGEAEGADLRGDGSFPGRLSSLLKKKPQVSPNKQRFQVTNLPNVLTSALSVDLKCKEMENRMFGLDSETVISRETTAAPGWTRPGVERPPFSLPSPCLSLFLFSAPKSENATPRL